MEKIEYIAPETEIVYFGKLDVITASTLESDEVIKMPPSV
jgi:hypothetical protein